MSQINKVIVGGNLARDPELRYTPKGVAVVDFTVCNNRDYKLDDGEKRRETAFVDVTAFTRVAEVISEYFRKGSGIIVEGRLKTESWEDRETGQKRSKTKVVLDSFYFQNEGKKTEDEPAPRPWTAKASSTARDDSPQESPVDNDDDVPF